MSLIKKKTIKSWPLSTHLVNILYDILIKHFIAYGNKNICLHKSICVTQLQADLATF